MGKLQSKNISFTNWLRDRKQEDTRIGDLARDMLQDTSWPKKATTKNAFRQHMEEMGACDAALETLDKAWTCYQQQKRGA